MSFDDNELTEYEKFLTKFKDNATYNQDFNKILVALGTIIDFGAFERRFRVEGKMKTTSALCLLIHESFVCIVCVSLTRFLSLEMVVSRIRELIRKIQN